jgi:hypothetical protein
LEGTPEFELQQKFCYEPYTRASTKSTTEETIKVGEDVESVHGSNQDKGIS